uniref:Tyr recombinase domain-containing protein n=1 Tax=Neobodo designis TaxID=312471 RepID=A0A7S1MDI9_NEODS|mmetsp:Transcript_38313/g.118403  ORF Transcript_38313/g.118403 Transcript_38313/m.118403 type:complete len:425 (+) Transcript_38313:1-1275(+)
MELCRTCGMWWGRHALRRVADVHPCIPQAIGEHPPWPMPTKEATGPVGVAELGDDSDSDDEPLAPSQDPPDFRPGEQLTRLGSLAMTPLRSLKILASADADLASAIVRKALSYETRQHHVRHLHKVARQVRWMESNNPDDKRLSQPLLPWLIHWLKGRGRRKKWKWSTQSAEMGSIQAAFRYLPTYVPGAPTWLLKDDVAWQLACRTCRNRARAEKTDQALPATVDQVHKACKFAIDVLRRPDIAALLGLTWITYGRASALAQAKREDIVLSKDPDGETVAAITMMRGKSNKLGQDPHTVTNPLGCFAPFVVEYLENITEPDQWIVFAPTRTERKKLLGAMNDALRNANGIQELETRSLRRGSLQLMAKAGATIEVLLVCSGHSSVRSLKRYLNFGRVMSAEQRKAGKMAGQLVTLPSPALQSC